VVYLPLKAMRKRLQRRIPMAHAVVMQVQLSKDDVPEEAIKMLNELVIPQAKAQAGFQSGTWMRNEETALGTGVVLFDTEGNAKAALKNLAPPPGGPELISSAVFTVGATA
jgi:hypothetical protein